MDTNHSPGNQSGYEKRDANVRNLLRFAAGLFVTLLVAAGISKVVFDYLGRVQKLGPPATPFEQARALPPLPQLQAHPESDLEELRAKDQQELDSYGWVDRTRGIVHIPIEKAMDLILERGLPARPAGAAPAEGSSAARAGTGRRAGRGGGNAP